MPTLTSGIDATWVNSGASYDAGELRRADAAIFSSGGVARGLDVSVTASDVVRVESGSWVIDGESTAEGAGVYRGGIGAQASANLEPRDATYGRVDLVVARQYDPDVVAAHGTYEGAVEVLTGTPSASPSAPALPTLAIELAKLDVPVEGGGSVAVDTSGTDYAATRSANAYLHAWKSTDAGRNPGGEAVVSWTDVEEAIGGAAAAGSVLTLGPAGLYHVEGAADATNSTGGYVQMFLRDVATSENVIRGISQRNGQYETVRASRIIRVAEGQTFEVYLQASSQNSGTSTFTGGKDRFYFTAVRVGD